MAHLWEPFLPGSSLVHQLDSRLKLLATLATVLVATLIPQGRWGGLLGLAMLLAMAVALSAVPLRKLVGRTALALPFVLLAALSVPFSREGQPLWVASLGPVTLTVTDAGLLAFLSILARAWLSLWAAALLVATTPLPALQQALWQLHLPPVLCNTIALMIRYLFVLVEEGSRLMAARAARTAGHGLGISERARVLGRMVGSLFVRSVARAERIHAAMLARGYDGTPRAPHGLSWRPTDTRAALVWTAGLAAALVLTIF